MLTRPSPRGEEMLYVSVCEWEDIYVAAVWMWRGERRRIISLRRARDGEKRKHTDYTGAELEAMLARGEDKSDLAAVKAMSEKELERLIAEDQDGDLSMDWSNAMINVPANKQGVFMRMDPHVLGYFRADGPGYQTRINAVLRSYVGEMLKRRMHKPAAE